MVGKESIQCSTKPLQMIHGDSKSFLLTCSHLQNNDCAQIYIVHKLPKYFELARPYIFNNLYYSFILYLAYYDDIICCFIVVTQIGLDTIF